MPISSPETSGAPKWRASVVAACLLAAAASGSAAAQEPVILYGMGTGRSVDDSGSRTSPPPEGGFAVPSRAQDAATSAFRNHQALWGAPKIDTLYNGRPVVFWLEDLGRGASAGNYLPVSRDTPRTLAGVLETGARQYYTFYSDELCTPAGQEGWCSSSHYSVYMRSGNMQVAWLLPLLFSHEFVHLKQREWIGNEIMDNYAPHWFYEGTANGWGYGLMEHGDLTRRSLARRLSTGSDRRLFGFFLGLRYYDQPLDVDAAVSIYPRNHPDYPSTAGEWRRYVQAGAMRCRDYGLREDASCRATLRSGAPDVRSAYDHVQMAGYMSGSFYRHMLVGRPQGARAVQSLMRRPAPQTTRSRDWLGWLDDGIRQAMVQDTSGNVATGPHGEPVRVWPGGVRQIYAEMISVLADLPDNAGYGRQGELAASRYDARLWSHGCPRIDLTRQDAVTREARIAPVAARCFRVRGPSTTEAETTLIVTVSSSQREACDDLQLGSRGQVLRNPTSVKRDDGCSIGWLVPFAPLNPTDPNGLQGDQHVLIINAAERATATTWRDVEVDFTYFQMGGSLDATAEPDERAEAPLPHVRDVAMAGAQMERLSPAKRIRRTAMTMKAPIRAKTSVRRVALQDARRLPSPRATEFQPAPLAIAIRGPSDDDASCSPADRVAFECGPMAAVGFVTGEVNDMVRHSVQMQTSLGLHDMRSATTETPGLDEDLFDIVNARTQQAQTQANALYARMARGAGPRGTRIELRLPPLELGQTGTFPARVNIEWSDGSPGGMGTINSLGPLGPDWSSGGCNEGTPPSRATVNITAHRPGYLIGSFSARLYRPNPDDNPDAVCRRPYVEAGQMSMNFVSGGLHPPLRENGGTTEVSSVWQERYALDDISAVLQAGGGIPAGMAGAFGAGDGSAAGSNTPATANVGQGQCPTTADVEAFIAAQTSQMRQAGITDRATLDQYGQMFRGLPRDSLEAAVCDWVAQGRPR